VAGRVDRDGRPAQQGRAPLAGTPVPTLVTVDSSALRFPGVYAATTTPFGTDGTADLDRFATHCSWLIDGGVAGLIPNGSLGEYEALSGAERADLVEAAIAAADGRVPVVPGVSGKSAAEACRWAEQASRAGAAAVMALPPTSHKPTPDEVVAHFAEIAKVGLPIIAYNNPFSTRVDLTPDLLARLAEIEQVQGVKEFSQDVRRVAQIRERAPRLEVICGCDDMFVEAMLLGATGWIAGLVNAFPAASVRLYELCVAGDFTTAVTLYRPMLPILRWDADPRFVQAIKMAQEEAGRFGGPVRLPRLPLRPAEADEVQAAAQAAIKAIEEFGAGR
jgi:1-pyrroline-4-hydroxy-2-carboxylate deaminase